MRLIHSVRSGSSYQGPKVAQLIIGVVEKWVLRQLVACLVYSPLYLWLIELEKHHETNHNVIFCFYPVCSLRGSWRMWKTRRRCNHVLRCWPNLEPRDAAMHGYKRLRKLSVTEVPSLLRKNHSRKFNHRRQYIYFFISTIGLGARRFARQLYFKLWKSCIDMHHWLKAAIWFLPRKYLQKYLRSGFIKGMIAVLSMMIF